jgi:hypothetical protein
MQMQNMMRYMGHCKCVTDGSCLTSFISVNWLLLLVVCAVTNASSQPDDPAMSMAAADADALLRPPESRENGAEIREQS